MEQLLRVVQQATKDELDRSIKAYFPLFHTEHEGYALLKEEVEEATEEVDKINQKLKMLWDSIKRNEYPNSSIHLIKSHAELLACEAIQVAAMVQKFIESFNGD